ncbi:MAG: amino acid permease [Metamycoplasmataceae bacterium]
MFLKKSKSDDSSKSKPINKKISLLQLVGLSIAFFGSIRNVPQVASAGYSSIIWMVLSIIIFVIPMGFIAAELATGWSKRGGPEVWVKEAFGKRAGFLVAWLLWVQMFFGMVIIGVGLATMIAFVIGDPIITTPWTNGVSNTHNLSTDPVFLAAFTIFIYWVITVLNFISNKVGKSLINIGAVVGIYVPFVFLTIFGISFISEQAIRGNFDLINNIPGAIFPPAQEGVIPQQAGGLQLFSQIMWIFIGLEIASTRANEIDNPKKNYSLGLLIVLVLMVIFNLGVGFIFAALVPNNEISLANAVIIPFKIILETWGAPWLVNIFALLMAFGMFSQLNSWILGPSNAMYATATEGTMPLFFHKKTKRDVPIVFVIVQAIAVTLFSILYAVLTITGAGNVFGILLNETIILYCIAYVLMIFAFIKLKYSKPDVVRGFTVPGKKVGAWVISILALLGVTMAIIVTFFQQQSTLELLLIQDLLVYVGLSSILILIPIGISFSKKFKDHSWLVASEQVE